MRLGFSAFSAVLFLLAGPASAAVATFSSEAYARVELVSVYLAGTTLDAWDFLIASDDDGQYYYDGYYNTKVGAEIEDWEDGPRLGYSGSVSGQVKSSTYPRTDGFSSGGSSVELTNEPEFYCDETCPNGYDLDLTFRYELFARSAFSASGAAPSSILDTEARADISIYEKEAWTWRYVSAGPSVQRQVEASAPPEDMVTDSASGIFSMRLEAGHAVDVYAGASVHADIRLAPVPAPASLPLLGGTFLGLSAFFRRRRAA